MGFLANIKTKIDAWWAQYKADVAIAKERQKMLRLIRDKSYAKEKGIQDAKTHGHFARAPREYKNSLLEPKDKPVDAIGTLEPKDAIGTIEPMNGIGNLDDMFKGFREEREEDENSS